MKKKILKKDAVVVNDNSAHNPRTKRNDNSIQYIYKLHLLYKYMYHNIKIKCNDAC